MLHLERQSSHKGKNNRNNVYGTSSTTSTISATIKRTKWQPDKYGSASLNQTAPIDLHVETVLTI